MAKNAKDAIRKDKLAPIDDVFVSDEWKEGKNNNLASAIGFISEKNNEE